MKTTALLTGGSRGIGKAIAEELRRSGYNVLSPSRKELDLASWESVGAFIKREKKNSVDIIVNNAGVSDPDLIENLSDRNIRDTIQVNLISPMLLIRGFVPGMKKRKWGRIVNISSIFGVVSRERRSLYSATKSGINGLTRALSIELGGYGILVNSVCPGYTETPMTKKNVSAKDRKELCKQIPLGRFALSAEIAKAVANLVSEENTYITGQTIVVDGGFTIR